LQFRLNLLPTHFLDNVLDPNPKHTNRQQVVASLVVDGDLDFVGFVDAEFVYFVHPLVIPRWLCAPLDRIFHLDVHKCLRAPTKATGSCVINVGDGEDAQ
jgi:hypothetical protein